MPRAASSDLARRTRPTTASHDGQGAAPAGRRGALALTWLLALPLGACGGASPAAAPTTYSVGVLITSQVAAGESFRFSLQSSAQFAIVQQGGVEVKFAEPLPAGTAYTVSQTDGPRSCTFSSNRTGTLAANVTVTADCGRPPTLTNLSGNFWGPVGAQVVLKLNGGGDLQVTVPPFGGGHDPYNLVSFSFATPLLDGAAYQVTLASQPAGQRCRVYAGASGTLPAAAASVRVGCEHLQELVSRSADESVRATFFESSAPSLGGDDVWGEGRFVAYVSSAANLAGNTAAHRQVFWRDRFTGQTVLLSAGPGGVEGDGDSFAPAVSADGLHVVFESHATNLVAGDTNGVRDVFLWAADGGIFPTGLERVSVDAVGVEANGESLEPAVSADGGVVAFSSGASNLAPGVSGTSTVNVYRWERATAAVALVSADAGGAGVGGARPALSEDGQRLAYCSSSAAIVPGDTNGLWDIFVRDEVSGTTSRVSLTQGGGERNQGTESASRVVAPALSGDGRFVAYATTASNVVAGDTNGAQDVFVVDTSTGAVVRASLSSAGAQGDADSPIGQGERVALSFDGSLVAFSSNATTLGATAGQVLLRDLAGGRTTLLSTGNTGFVGPPSLSRTGAYAAYGASSPLDPRFTSSGLFATFTGLTDAYFWR